MTTIAIVPDYSDARPTSYRAIAGRVQSVGGTAGEALDAVTAQLSEAEIATLVIVQHQRPDQFFTADQQKRLQDLMARWRAMRIQRLLRRSRRNLMRSSRQSCGPPQPGPPPWSAGWFHESKLLP